MSLAGGPTWQARAKASRPAAAEQAGAALAPARVRRRQRRGLQGRLQPGRSAGFIPHAGETPAASGRHAWTSTVRPPTGPGSPPPTSGGAAGPRRGRRDALACHLDRRRPYAGPLSSMQARGPPADPAASGRKRTDRRACEAGDQEPPADAAIRPGAAPGRLGLSTRQSAWTETRSPALLRQGPERGARWAGDAAARCARSGLPANLPAELVGRRVPDVSRSSRAARRRSPRPPDRGAKADSILT